jgi:hypothetical protein
MARSLRSVLGYAAAVTTLAAMIATPFVLMPALTRAVAATGVRVDPSYVGGRVRATVDRGAYRIDIHERVSSPAPLTRIVPYVQLGFAPARALPSRVDELVDLDGDGRPDARVRFEPGSRPRLLVEVDALTPLVRPLRKVAVAGLSALILRVGDSVVVRIPVTR